MTDRVVGVVVDESTVRAAEYRRGRFRGGGSVARAGAVPLPPGAVDQGEVVDADVVAEALGRLWSEAGFSTKRTAMGLDPRATVIRRVDLPAVSSKDQAQAAAYEIGELLSYPLDEAVVSMVEMGHTSAEGGDAVQALILAVHENTLAGLRGVAKLAGLKPTEPQLVPAALLVGVDATGPLGAGRVGAVVSVSETVTTVIVHDARGLLFCRVVTAGLSAGGTTLSDELEMELAVLNGFAGGDGTEGGTASPFAATPGLATVVEGVRRTLHYYTTELDSRPIERVVLCGPQSGARGLATDLAESFPTAEVLRYQRSPWTVADHDPSSFDEAVAVAHAATGAAKRLRAFDLVPPVERERRAGRRRIAAGVATAVALSPLLVADTMDRRSALADERAAAEAIELAAEGLRSELSAYQDDRAREALADRQTDRVNALYAQEFGFSTVIRQMAEAMPSDTFLLSLRVNRAQAGEAPTGYTGSVPPALVTITGVAEDLDGVGRWIQTVADVPSVDGLWLAQSAFGPYGGSDQVAAVFTVDGVVTDPAVPIRTMEAPG